MRSSGIVFRYWLNYRVGDDPVILAGGFKFKFELETADSVHKAEKIINKALSGNGPPLKSFGAAITILNWKRIS